jgi:uncharacterized SAM-binding protein YcdF (DUF218 family)
VVQRKEEEKRKKRGRKEGTVAQWQSRRILIFRLLVRVQSVPFSIFLVLAFCSFLVFSLISVEGRIVQWLESRSPKSLM